MSYIAIKVDCHFIIIQLSGIYFIIIHQRSNLPLNEYLLGLDNKTKNKFLPPINQRLKLKPYRRLYKLINPQNVGSATNDPLEASL